MFKVSLFYDVMHSYLICIPKNLTLSWHLSLLIYLLNGTKSEYITCWLCMTIIHQVIQIERQVQKNEEITHDRAIMRRNAFLFLAMLFIAVIQKTFNKATKSTKLKNCNSNREPMNNNNMKIDTKRCRGKIQLNFQECKRCFFLYKIVNLIVCSLFMLISLSYCLFENRALNELTVCFLRARFFVLHKSQVLLWEYFIRW